MASLLASLPLPLSRILVDTSTGDTLEWARGQREASQRLHDAYVREWLRADIWLDSSVAEMELVCSATLRSVAEAASLYD